MSEKQTFVINANELGLTKVHLDAIWADITRGNGPLDEYRITITYWPNEGWYRPHLSFHGRCDYWLNLSANRTFSGNYGSQEWINWLIPRIRESFLGNVGWIDTRVKRALQDVVDEFTDRGYSFKREAAIHMHVGEHEFEVVSLIGGWHENDSFDSKEYVLENNNMLNIPDWVRQESKRFFEVAVKRLKFITGAASIKTCMSVHVNKAGLYQRSYVAYVDDPKSVYHERAVGFTYYDSPFINLANCTVDARFAATLEHLRK